MDKKMHDKDLLPGQQPPVAILPVKDAWAEMRKKLDDKDPSAIVLPSSNSSIKTAGQKRILRLSLLLLLLLITMFFVNQINKRGNNNLNPIVNDREIENPGKGGSVSNTKDRAKENGINTNEQAIDQIENKEAINGSELKQANDTPGSKKFDDNKKEFSNKTRNSISDKNSSSSKKQSVNSKKQKLKRKTSSNTGAGDNLKDQPRAANSPSDMQTLVNDPSVLKKDIVDSTAEVKAKIDVKKDSSLSTISQPEESTPQYKPVITVGLHWNFQVPVYGGDNYFKGPSATSRPYSVLLPGIWVSVKQDDKMLRAELSPFYSNLLPARSFGTFTDYTNTTDSVFITTETKTLRKTFGINFTANYDLNITGNWWAGGGIDANWMRNGVASASGVEERRSVSSGGVVTNNINRSYTLSKTEWENFARFQIGIHAEVNYITKKMQTGFRVGLPVTPVAKHKGQKNSIRTEVILRLPLFNSGRKIVD